MGKAAVWAAKLTANTVEFGDNINKAAEDAVKKGGIIEGSFDRVALSAVAMGTTVVAGLTATYIASAKAGDQAAKTADKLGLTTEALGGLRHAAELSGAGTTTLDMGLQRMTRRVAAAANGTGEAVKALDELGLSAQALNAMSPDQQFSAIAEAMGEVESQGDKVRLTFALFDSEGVNLVNTMAMGADGLASAAAEAERLGISLNRADAAKLEAANDAMYRAGQVAKGAGNIFTVELAPYVQAVADHFFNTALEAGGFGDIVTDVADGAVSAVGFIADGVKGIELAWHLVKLGSIEAVMSGLNVLQDLDSGITGFLNKIPGVTLQESSTIKLHIAAMGLAAKDARADLDEFSRELIKTGLPSDQIEKLANKIKRQSQEVADTVAAAASGSKAPVEAGVDAEQDSKLFAKTVAANDALIQEHMRLTDSVVNLDHYRYEQKRIAIEQQITDARAKGDAELDLIDQLNIQKELLHANHLAKLKRDEEKAEKEKRKRARADAKYGLNQMTDSLAAVSQHSKDAFHAWQLSATAKAVVDTYSAATGAYNAMAGIPVVGPALGVAAAAAAVAAGMANVQAIKNTQYGSASGASATAQASSVPSVSTAASDPVGPTEYREPSEQSPFGGGTDRTINITLPGGLVIGPDTLDQFGELMREVYEADYLKIHRAA